MATNCLMHYGHEYGHITSHYDSINVTYYAAEVRACHNPENLGPYTFLKNSKSIFGFSKMDKNKCPILGSPFENGQKVAKMTL